MKWLAIIWGIIFLTIQTQDLPNIERNLAHKRRTLLLVYSKEVIK